MLDCSPPRLQNCCLIGQILILDSVPVSIQIASGLKMNSCTPQWRLDTLLLYDPTFLQWIELKLPECLLYNNTPVILCALLWDALKIVFWRHMVSYAS